MSLVRVTGAVPLDGLYGDDLRACAQGQRTVVPEDMVDVALRNAKSEAEFDAIYAYSGRPVSSWEERHRAEREADEWIESLMESLERDE